MLIISISGLVACNSGNVAQSKSLALANQARSGELAKHSNALNSLLAANPSLKASNKCLYGRLVQTIDHDNHIKSSIKVINNCKVVQNLADYQFAFVSEDLERNQFLLADLTAATTNQSIASLKFTSYSTDEVTHDHAHQQVSIAADLLCGSDSKSGCDISLRPKNLIIGSFSSKRSSDGLIAPNQTIEFFGEALFDRNVGYDFNFAYDSFTSYLIVEKVPTFGLLICDPLRAHHESDIDTSIADNTNLKMIEITNATTNLISALRFPSELPEGVSYDAKHTTCLLSGHQNLIPRQSCLLAFKYIPDIVVGSTNLRLEINGSTQVNGIDENIVSSPMNIEFTPTRIKQESPVLRKTNVALTDLVVESHDYALSQNDSLINVEVGSSGLKELMVTNNTTFDIYALTFPLLPNEFSYDEQTTCKTSIGNKPMLSPGDKCMLVIRYTPSHAGAHGKLPITITGANNYFDVVVNKDLYLVYSSEK